MIERYASDSALVVIDPQAGIDDLDHWGGPRGRRNNPDAESRLSALLNCWRSHGFPVFFTKHDSLEAQSPLRSDRPTGAFKEHLVPRPDEVVILKSVNGAFFGTDLELRLRRAGVHRLIVAGFFTNMCVETTVRTSGNLGYDTYLAHDACSTTNRIGPDGVDHDPETVHQLAIASLHGEFCTALTTDQICGLAITSNHELSRVQGNEP